MKTGQWACLFVFLPASAGGPTAAPEPQIVCFLGPFTSVYALFMGIQNSY